MAIAVAIAFSSCDGKKKKVRDDDDSSSSSQSESVEKGPTGDPKKDAKVLADHIIELLDEASTKEELDDVEKELDKLDVEYRRFYKQKDDHKKSLHKFMDALDAEDDRIDRAYEKAKERIRGKNDSRRDEEYEKKQEYGLTGDPAQDAQMAANELKEIMSTEIYTKEDAEMLDDAMNEFEQKYENFYKDDPEAFAEFQKEFRNHFNSVEQKELEKLYEKVQELKNN